MVFRPSMLCCVQVKSVYTDHPTGNSKVFDLQRQLYYGIYIYIIGAFG